MSVENHNFMRNFSNLRKRRSLYYFCTHTFGPWGFFLDLMIYRDYESILEVFKVLQTLDFSLIGQYFFEDF